MQLTVPRTMYILTAKWQSNHVQVFSIVKSFYMIYIWIMLRRAWKTTAARPQLRCPA